MKNLAYILLLLSALGTASCSKDKPLTEEVNTPATIQLSGKWSEVKRIFTVVPDSSSKPLSSDTTVTKRGAIEIVFSADLITYYQQSKKTMDRKYVYDGTNLTIFKSSAQEMDAEKYILSKTDSEMTLVMKRRTSNGIIYKDETTTIYYVKQ